MDWSSKTTKIIAGVDLGSSNVTVVISELNNNGQINVLGYGKSPLTGIERGKIVNEIALQNAVSSALQRAELKSGVRPKTVITTVPNYKIMFKQNLGVVISTEDDGKISEEDKKRCIKKARNIVKPADYRILHVIPLKYRVDGKEVRSPVGIKGTHLEVETRFVLAQEDNLTILKRCFKDLSCDVTAFLYDGLTQSELILNREDRHVGSLLLDIGGHYTKASYFINNAMTVSSVLPIGGETITSDIATCLKVTIPEAERLKIIYGTPIISDIDASEEIDVSTKEGKKQVKKRLLGQIIEARIAEILKLIRANLGDVFTTANAVFLSGESAQLTGLSDFISHRFSKTIKTLPKIQGLQETESLIYVGALGSIVYGVKTGLIGLDKSAEKTGFQKKGIKKVLSNWLRK